MKKITFLIGLSLIIVQLSAQEKDDLYNKPTLNDESPKVLPMDASKVQYYQLKFNGGGNLVSYAVLDIGTELIIWRRKDLIREPKSVNALSSEGVFPTPMEFLNFICQKYGLEVHSWEVHQVSAEDEYRYLLIKSPKP